MPSARDERLATLRARAEGLLRAGAGGAQAWARAERVYGLARHLARQEEADRFIVGAAALLYQLPDEEGDAELGRLEGAAEVALAVRETIVAARGDLAPGASLESRVLRDALALDQLGATGIAGALLDGVVPGEGWHERLDPFALMRGLEPARYPLDRIYARLVELPQQMGTPTARGLAARRAGIMLFFLESLRDEFAPALPDALLPEGDWLVPREGEAS